MYKVSKGRWNQLKETAEEKKHIHSTDDSVSPIKDSDEPIAKRVFIQKEISPKNAIDLTSNDNTAHSRSQILSKLKYLIMHM